MAILREFEKAPKTIIREIKKTSAKIIETLKQPGRQSPFVSHQSAVSARHDVVIYSAYCGTNKNITFKKRQYRKYKSVFFSNNHKVLKLSEKWGWIPVYLENCPLSDNPVVATQQAKLHKINPHRMAELKDHRYSLWLDDKIDTNEEDIDQMVDDLIAQQAALSLRQHPFLSRNILYDLLESMWQGRYRRQRDQIVDYLTRKLEVDGFNLQGQLYWCSKILRDMRHKDIIEIGQRWEIEQADCGIKDQISFYFVAQMFESIAIMADNHERVDASSAMKY